MVLCCLFSLSVRLTLLVAVNLARRVNESQALTADLFTDCLLSRYSFLEDPCQVPAQVIY